MKHEISLPDFIPPSAVARWERAIREMTTPAELTGLTTSFDYNFGDIIISTGIPFASLCEHHLFPFFGTVDVGYIPERKIVGLSKLARTVEALSKRIQTQERFADSIADAIYNASHSEEYDSGVAVKIIGTHTCQTCRGVRKSGKMITVTTRGMFDDNSRREFLELIK